MHLAIQLAHDDVALLDQTDDPQLGAAADCQVLDLGVVGLLADQVIAAKDGQLNVVGQAGQDLTSALIRARRCGQHRLRNSLSCTPTPPALSHGHPLPGTRLADQI